MIGRKSWVPGGFILLTAVMLLLSWMTPAAATDEASTQVLTVTPGESAQITGGQSLVVTVAALPDLQIVDVSATLETRWQVHALTVSKLSETQYQLTLPRELPVGGYPLLKVAATEAAGSVFQLEVMYRTALVTKSSGAGISVVIGDDPVVGHRRARLVRYTVEVQNSLKSRTQELLSMARSTLGDTDFGWTARGDHRLQRVGSPTTAQIRVVLATASLTNRLCGQVGLRTAGRYSCWNGQFAVLNVRRWRDRAPGFRTVTQHRHYQINHEVGHGLGYQHRWCSHRGARAPVMQQQTISLQGCRANGWPYPS